METRQPRRAPTKSEEARATETESMIGDILKAGGISVAVAIILAFAASYYLQLSPSGIRNITFISVVLCLALGQVVRFIWSILHRKK
jgi:ABC-type spermidine/putrescine transport system permease subunit I